MKEIIFISGIHGVGKSTFSKNLSDCLNIPCYSASSLIRKQNEELFFPNKQIKNITNNQNVLLQAIENFVIEDCFILDGHFTLQNENKEILKVPKELFFTLNPKVIISLQDSAENIAKRINNRDVAFFEESFLQQMQYEEVKYANDISCMLNADLIQLFGFEAFNSFINKQKKETSLNDCKY